jgi:allantoate deiminase
MTTTDFRARSTEEAALIMKRLEELGAVSDEPDQLTRYFRSHAMARANEMVEEWMKEAGMTVHHDGWGNMIGRLPIGLDHPKVVLLGSHLDTVRNAGKYDGPLGVLLGVAAVRLVREAGQPVPFHLDVAAFSDEEGLRFQLTYLGSRALSGQIEPADLDVTDADGVRLGDLIEPPNTLPDSAYEPGELRAYLEAHIEQGPVLEAAGHPIGIVTGIAGQTRARVKFIGRADHAGTCPMNLRKDALPAAAEMILATEQLARGTTGLVATVGQVNVLPGASNVVPGSVELTLDVRHLQDARRLRALSLLEAGAAEIAEHRGVSYEWTLVQSNSAVPCDPTLREVLYDASRELGIPAMQLPSGAGHDAAMIAHIAPVAMLFVRSPGGISHHPDEAVLEWDVADALHTLVTAIYKLAAEE